MDNAGDPEAGGSPHNGDAYEAALGEDHVRPVAFQEPAGFREALDDPEGVCEVFEIKIAPQLPCRHSNVGNAAVEHQFLLDPVLRTDIGDLIARFPKRGQQGDVRCHVPGGPAAGQDDLSLR